jgi:methylthioribose-1-phosphate isomerase
MRVKSIEWRDEKLFIIDQTLLPEEYKVIELSTLELAEDAIRRLRVRGAPAIGIAAAYGAYVAFRNISALPLDEFKKEGEEILARLNATRPTAVNLSWALKQIEEILRRGNDVESILDEALKKAKYIHLDDEERCRKMGENGQELIPRKANILTHCNTGALATGGTGTALSLVYSAWEENKDIHVYMDETRPLLQGARLTAWELVESGIPATLITDSMAAWLMRQGGIDLVIVGADRIAANGDAANKIGTYSLAVNARHHGVPFYVVAPLSTFDLSLKSGKEIVIEERDGEEIKRIGECRTAPSGVETYNPAFDVTPAELITAIITEKKIIRNEEFNQIINLN